MNRLADASSPYLLQHELGHGLHGVLAQPLGLFNSSTPLTTAETASVFGEALTFELLLANEDDPRRRLDLLTGRIEDAIATTFRQIAMNRFEHAVHTERRDQGELSPERIGELWLEAQNALFADSVSTEGYMRGAAGAPTARSGTRACGCPSRTPWVARAMPSASPRSGSARGGSTT